MASELGFNAPSGARDALFRKNHTGKMDIWYFCIQLGRKASALPQGHGPNLPGNAMGAGFWVSFPGAVFSVPQPERRYGGRRTALGAGVPDHSPGPRPLAVRSVPALPDRTDGLPRVAGISAYQHPGGACFFRRKSLRSLLPGRGGFAGRFPGGASSDCPGPFSGRNAAVLPDPLPQ